MEDGTNGIILGVHPSANDIQSAHVIGHRNGDNSVNQGGNMHPGNSVRMDMTDLVLTDSDRMQLANLKPGSTMLLSEELKRSEVDLQGLGTGGDRIPTKRKASIKEEMSSATPQIVSRPPPGMDSSGVSVQQMSSMMDPSGVVGMDPSSQGGMNPNSQQVSSQGGMGGMMQQHVNQQQAAAAMMMNAYGMPTHSAAMHGYPYGSPNTMAMNAYQNMGGHPYGPNGMLMGGHPAAAMAMAQAQAAAHPGYYNAQMMMQANPAMMYAGMGGGGPGSVMGMGDPSMTALQQQMCSVVSPMTNNTFPQCEWYDPMRIHEIEVRELKSTFPRLSVYSPSASSSDQSSIIEDPSSQQQQQSTSSTEQPTSFNSENNKQATTTDSTKVNSPPSEEQHLYMTIRNSIIDAYRASYPMPLTVADCRKFIDGDLFVLLTLFMFLCSHSLINFATQKQALATNPAEVPIKQAYKETLSPANDLKKRLKSPVFDFKGFPTCVQCQRICLFSFCTLPNGPVALGPGSLSVWCTDCSQEAPHSQMLVKITQPTSFVIDQVRWTDRQLLRLFDAIEIFGLDWVAVCKYVSEAPGMPVVSPQRCLSAFLFLFGETVPTASPSLTLPKETNAFPEENPIPEPTLRELKSTLSTMSTAAIEQAASEAVLAAITSLLESKQPVNPDQALPSDDFYGTEAATAEM